MRGVYPWIASRPLWTAGSSPHARGLLEPVHGDADAARIIPARAGFTCPSRSSPTCRRDHPRMRGVYCERPSVAFPTAGSSPHARGLLPYRKQSRRDDRIIPACAGFTPPGGSPGRWRRDHPRMRGVYANTPRIEGDTNGSSPHARGLHAGSQAEALVVRIIPACAGFTDGVVPDHQR